MKKEKNRRLLSIMLVVCVLVTTVIPGFGHAVYAETSDATVIDVTEYGADPTGVIDSAVAIQRAIEAAKGVEGPVIINFPTGEYQIYPDRAAERELYISNTVGTDQSHKMKKIGILLENMNNVTVEGNDSLFLFHGKMTTFAAIGCTNVTFQNYKVDFQVPTVIDVTVEAVADDSATIYVPECYNYEVSGNQITWKSEVSPYSGNLYWSTKNGMNYSQTFDLKTGLTTRGGNPIFNNVSSIEDLGNNRLKFKYSTRPSNIAVGICYQMRPTVRDHAGTFFWKSENVTMNNLDIHFLHGFGMVGQSTTNLHMNDVDFETPKGSGRTTAGYADFVQMSGCKGEIRIENSSFSNPHDDPINIHGTFMQVVEKLAANKFKVRYMHNETAGFPNFFVGDQVEFMTKGNMIPVENSVATITEVSGPSGNGGASTSGTGSLTDIIITLDKDMPEEIQVNQHVVENITYTPSVVIQNNVFKETPTRGILVTTRKPVKITNNYFDGMGMAAIYISNDAQGWYESGPTKDVVIESNVFYRSGLGTATQPVIYIDPTNPTVSQDKTVHDNIVVQNNKFYMKNNQVLGGKSVKNITFQNNEIYRYDPNVNIVLSTNKTELVAGDTVNLTTNATGNSLSSNLFSFNGCKNVTIANNLYDGGLKLNASTQNMNGATVTIGENEGVVVDGASNSKGPVGNLYYESSNEEVLKVSASGTVRAINAGRATVKSYTIVGGRKFVSNQVEFTVAAGTLGNLPTNITVGGGEELVQEHNVQINYTVTIAPEDANKTIAWNVVDPFTGNTSVHATIDDSGTVRTVSNGVVEVVATSVNGLEARKLLVIQKAGSALNNKFTVVNPVNDKWSITGEDKIQIKAQSSGLWATQTAKNITLASMVGDMENVTATVKLIGKTKANYDEAGLIFYKDNDNYVSAERKHGDGTPKIHVVTEANGAPNEDGSVANSNLDNIYFKLEKAQNTITGYYSEDGVNFIKIREVTNSSLGSTFKIGVIAASGSNSETPYEFTQLKVNGEHIPFTMLNAAPSASNVVATYNEEQSKLRVAYDYADENNDLEGTSLVKWAVSETRDGIYTLLSGVQGKEIATTEVMSKKYVKAVVVPQDKKGSYGAPVWQSQGIFVTGEGSTGEVEVPKSANTKLVEASVSGVGDFGSFDKNNKYYITTATAEQSMVNASFKAEDRNANIELLVNGMKLGTGQAGDLQQNQIPLINGQNVLVIRVTAEDMKTIEEYRFTILRTGFNNSDATGIKIANVALEGFNKDTMAYSYSLGSGTTSTKVEVLGTHESANVSIIANNKITNQSVTNVSLQPGANKVVVKIKPDTSAATKFYTVNIKVPKVDNAGLEAMKFGVGVKLEQVFDTNTLVYTGKATSKIIPLNLVAEEKEATLEVKLNEKVIATGAGVIVKDIPMYIGENVVKIKVTSPDKTKEKQYVVTVTGIKTHYLSDMEFDASQSSFSYKAPGIDVSIDGNPLRLRNESGEAITFEKGLGGHADSVLVYDLKGTNYKEFSTYMGVDQESANNNQADVIFKISIDDKEVFNSGIMTATTPMVFKKINLEGVSKLKLEILKNVNDWNDHADFGDAKFTTDLEEPTIEPEPTYTIRVEEVENGIINIDKTTAKEGETVKVSVTPAKGYELEVGSLKANGKEIIDSTFTMPASNVIVTASFAKKPPIIVPVESVSLNKTSVDLKVGETVQLNAVVLPENATNKGIVFVSENEAIAKVTDAGVITGIAKGQTSIKVITEDGKKEASCVVNISEVIPKPEYTPGWNQDNKGWFFVYKDGTKAINKWQLINAKWYYFDMSGYMQTEWKKINGKWYYLGKINDGSMKTGWQKISGKWYYLGSANDGSMKTGWQKVNGKWYLLATSGRMLTGWQKVTGSWYYLEASGKMATGWVKDGRKWYYLSGSGKMQVGWVFVKGKWYYLHSNGKMATGWTYDGKKTYYLSSTTGAWNGQVR